MALCNTCGKNPVAMTYPDGEHICFSCLKKEQIKIAKLREKEKRAECPNCEGENAITGFVELWDGICPDCGRVVEDD